MKLAGHPAPSQVLRDVAAPAGALPAARDRIGDHQRPPERAGGNHRGWNGAPGRSRTCDPRIRSPMLYPTELRAPGHLQYTEPPRPRACQSSHRASSNAAAPRVEIKSPTSRLLRALSGVRRSPYASTAAPLTSTADPRKRTTNATRISGPAEEQDVHDIEAAERRLSWTPGTAKDRTSRATPTGESAYPAWSNTSR